MQTQPYSDPNPEQAKWDASWSSIADERQNPFDLRPKRFVWPFEGFVLNTARLVRKDLLTLNDPVLDFGCGPGRHAVFFARSGFQQVSGVDISATIIGVAQAWSRREGLRIAYTAFDGVRLPYPDASFKVACCFGTFHHLPREQHCAVASELSRVIAPTGFLLWAEQSARTTRRRPGRRIGTHTIVIEEEGNPEAGMLQHFFTLSECRQMFPNFEFKAAASEYLEGDGLDDASALWNLLGVKRK